MNSILTDCFFIFFSAGAKNAKCEGNRLVLTKLTEHHKLLQCGLGAGKLKLKDVEERMMPMIVFDSSAMSIIQIDYGSSRESWN